MAKLNILITLCLIASGAMTYAEEITESWSFEQCVDYARSHNIDLQKALLSSRTAEINLDEAKAQWQPTLDFGTTQGFTNSPFADNDKNAYSGSYGLSAGWTVYNGGLRKNNIKRAHINSQISSLDSSFLLRSLETDMLQIYLNILYAKETIGICEEAARLSGAQASRAQMLMEAGKLSRVDYAQLESQHEQDNYALVEAQATYQTRRMELKKLLELGIDKEITLNPLDWHDNAITAPLPDMEESYRLALNTDIRLKSLMMQTEGSEVDIEIAKASGRPQIDLTAGVNTAYGTGGPSLGTALKENLNEHIGLTINIPVFDRKKTSSAVAKARVDQLSARLDIDQRENDLAQAVESWYTDTRSAQARYKAAVSRLNAAELTSQLTIARFELGLVNTVEMMTAHNNLTDARQQLIQAKYMAMLGRKMIEYYRTSHVSLP